MTYFLLFIFVSAMAPIWATDRLLKRLNARLPKGNGPAGIIALLGMIGMLSYLVVVGDLFGIIRDGPWIIGAWLFYVPWTAFIFRALGRRLDGAPFFTWLGLDDDGPDGSTQQHSKSEISL